MKCGLHNCALEGSHKERVPALLMLTHLLLSTSMLPKAAFCTASVDGTCAIQSQVRSTMQTVNS